jgi:selenocysteine-specific elongation factor
VPDENGFKTAARSWIRKNSASQLKSCDFSYGLNSARVFFDVSHSLTYEAARPLTPREGPVTMNRMSTPATNARTQFVIGLAGHIDHGKSALVHTLTGGAVDRLAEERRRGITIELGFAHFKHDGQRFALIDVPGHERFIHTMVAGASGVDAALLVVAADDSVMPQTREHFALLELLGIRHGVVAITKCDLADEEQLELVELEIAELAAGTFLSDAPRIRVSVVTGNGIEELRNALVASARHVPSRRVGDARFRLPIDRSFSATGQGAVVTGTVWRGTTRVGDKLSILPDGTEVRVRRLQSQGTDVEQVSAGQRAAINLAGVKATAIRRGDELAASGAYEPGRRHLVRLRILPDAPRGIKNRQPVRVHLGANQATAQVLMQERAIGPGGIAFGILRCDSPIVAEYGQPFVLRQLSPARTIGGGTIVSPALRPTDRQNRCLAAAEALAGDDLHARLAAYVDLRREATFDEASESWVGLPPGECQRVLQELERRGEIVRIPAAQSRFVSKQRFCKLKARMLREVQAELERRRPASLVLLSVVMSGMSRHASEPVLDAMLADMVARREIVLRGERVGLPSGAELSNRQRGLLVTLVEEVTGAGATPPTLKEFAERHGQSERDLEPLVQVAVDEGLLIRLTPQIVINREALEALRQRLAAHFNKSPTAKVGEMREQWGITRKHAVPIFEFFDQCQITSRSGDIRSAGPRVAVPVGEVSA